MDPRVVRSAGFLDNLRQFGGDLLGAAHDRLVLLSIELQEHKLRLVRLLVLAATVLACAVLALVFGLLALILALDPAWRPAALGGVGGLFLLVGAGVALRLLRRLGARPGLISATLEEVRAHRARCLRDN